MKDERRRRQAEKCLERIGNGDNHGIDTHNTTVTLIVGLLHLVLQKPTEKIWYAARAICKDTRNNWILGEIPYHVQENLKRIKTIMYDSFYEAARNMEDNLGVLPIGVYPSLNATSEERKFFQPKHAWASRQASRYIAGLRGRFKKGMWDGEMETLAQIIYPDEHFYQMEEC